MAANRVEQCIELLCQRGCREVHQIIAQLEQGESLEAVAQLTSSEKTEVLEELRAIMAIYQNCRIN